jgi:putative ABC transport system permease protein
MIANLIAWPLGGLLLQHWLMGFSARISLTPLYFIAAGGAAVTVSLLTVAAHAVLVAQQKPVRALRYE